LGVKAEPNADVRANTPVMVYKAVRAWRVGIAIGRGIGTSQAMHVKGPNSLASLGAQRRTAIKYAMPDYGERGGEGDLV